ncbi:Autophagy protein 22 [Puccinia graminis f. sp. tritici]|uniref:Autophagy-related protein n=1 Tax=Puccinia graminis f. sp. tritici TaxID=56615 RepID=A0A5B0MCP6_PUCGR|nr:Autophagy protein 22 [Puccinia graminis f. sp. tritici]
MESKQPPSLHLPSIDTALSLHSSSPDTISSDSLSDHTSNQSARALLHPEIGPVGSVKRHVWGFYCYSIASEIYAIVSTTLFLPIVLEQFARDNARLYPDYTQPCPGSSGSSSWQKRTTTGSDQGLSELVICKTKVLGGWVNTSVFPLYVSSLTIAVLAFIIVSMSSPADDAKMRKVLLIILAGFGSLTGSMFFFLESSSPIWPIAGLLSLVSNVCLGASAVCLNSLLSGISKEKASKIWRKEGNNEHATDREYKALASQCTSQISARGVAYGFGSGIVALVLCLIFVIHRKGDLDSLRWAIGGSAVCWGLLTIPTGLWIPPTSSFSFRGDFSNPFRPIKSCKEMLRMLKGFRNLSQTIKFLMAWALLSNSYSTMTSTAILYAKTYLKMESTKLIIIGIITPLMGIMGALMFSLVQSHLHCFSGVDSNLKILKSVVIPTCAIPLYISTSVVFGSNALSSERDMYLVAGFFGLFYGAFQSYSRAVFTELLPPGQEARWNSLFSLTAKASSCSGPLVVGIITEITHDMRYGFVFILILFVGALLVLQTINMEAGRLDAENYGSESWIDEEPKHFVLSDKSEEAT